ncbi:hypothetical protein LJB90_01720 [Eubacteriales bacterium OttesenSCG-928-G02]|nr:hypothetical protein [Eubacteriales bacterium OttesenSCG-928-G02]
MAGKKGMKNYPEAVKEELRKAYKEGQSVNELSKKYGISRYAIQSWCGLRPETKIRQIAPLPKGRTKIIKTIDDYKKENKRLKMENELMRDFLSLAERK